MGTAVEVLRVAAKKLWKAVYVAGWGVQSVALGDLHFDGNVNY